MTSSRLALLLVVGLATLFAWPSTVAAQQPSSDEESGEISDEEARERATDLYRQAGQAYADGYFERAAELLDRAHEYDDKPVYRYNQILALEGAGDYDEALELLDRYDEAIRALDETEDIDGLRAELREAADEKETPEPVAEVPPEPPEESDEPDDVDPPADKPPPEEATADGEDDGTDVVAWSLVGTGAASLAGGLVVGSGMLIGDTIERLESSTTPEEAREVYDDSPHDRREDEATLRTHQYLAAGLLTAGVVAGATGATMLWLGRTPEESAERTAFDARPAVGLDSVGLVLEGRF